MAGDGPDRLLVAFAPGDALVEASDVALRRPAAIEADGVGGFNEGPLEVAVDVGAGRTEARVPLGQGRVTAILELRALPHEHHPRPRQVALVAQLARRNPDRRERAGALELIEPRDLELIGLIDLAHHEFGLAGVHEPGDATGGLDLVDDPIPITNGLDRHRGAPPTALAEPLEPP